MSKRQQDEAVASQVSRPMTPSEAREHLLRVEREKDKLRELEGIFDVPSLMRTNSSYESRPGLTQRRTTVLTREDALRMTERLGPREDASTWIRDAIVERLDRLDARDKNGAK